MKTPKFSLKERLMGILPTMGFSKIWLLLKTKLKISIQCQDNNIPHTSKMS